MSQLKISGICICCLTLCLAQSGNSTITGYINNPSGNSSDWSNAVIGSGGAVNNNVNFDSMPTGPLDGNFYKTSDNVALSASGNVGSVTIGVGPSQGNNSAAIVDPGEGVHVSSNYLQGGSGLWDLTVDFDNPVSGFGLFTIDYFGAQGSTEQFEIKAYAGVNGSGTLLGTISSLNRNYQTDNLYFMGLLSDSYDIMSVVFIDYNGGTGDVIGIDNLVFSILPPVIPPSTLNAGTPGYLYLNNPSYSWHSTVWQSSPTSSQVLWADGCDANFIGSGSTYNVTLSSPVTVRDMSLTGGQLSITSSSNRVTFTDPSDGYPTIGVTSGNALSFNAPITATGGLARTGTGDVRFNRPLSVKNSLMLLSGATIINSSASVGGTTSVDGSLTVNGSLNSGQLSIGGTGSATINNTASIAGSTSVDGNLTVNGSLNSGQLSIGGTGSATINNTASVTENTSVDGNLTVNGSLNSGQLSIGGTGSATINNTASVAVNTSVDGNLTVNGTMSTETLEISTSGSTWINGRLTANGTHNYGYLNVNGTLDSPINNRGFLGGSGHINGSVYNHKIISPGNSIGTLTVNGSYTHGSGATFIAEVDKNGGSDLLYVTGKADINGGTVTTNLPRALYTDGYSWNFLQTSDGLNGQFVGLTGQPNSSTLSLSLDYTPNQANIKLNRKSYATFNNNKGAQSIGRALDSYVPLAINRGDAMENLLIAMDFDYSSAAISNTLSKLNPEIYPTFLAIEQQAALRFSQSMNQRSSLVRELHQLNMEKTLDKAEVVVPQANGGELKATAYAPDWLIWGKAQGESVFKDTTNEYNGYDFKTGGAIIGADTKMSDSVRFGMATAFETTDIEWKQGADGTQDNIILGLYAGGQFDGYYADAQGSIGFHDNKASRAVFNSSKNANFNGQSYMAHLGGGYDFQYENCIVGPLASLSYVHVRTSDFSESGNGYLSLNVDDSSEDVFLSYIGFHAASKFIFGQSTMATRLELAWQHNFHGDEFQMDGWFNGYSSFTFSGPGWDQDMLVAKADATMSLGEQLSAYVELGGAMGTDTKAYNASVGLQWLF